MQHASNPVVDAYIRGVLDGSVPVNELACLAIERHVADLERWPCVARRGDTPEQTAVNVELARAAARTRGDEFYFDEDAAEFVLEFERLCVFFQGDLDGRQFEPLPYQAAVEWISHGWMFTATGSRRFNERWVEEPRGNGKTYWLACHELYMFAADGEPGAQVYSVATKKDQVSKEGVWHDASWIVRKSPALQADLAVQDSFNNHRIYIPNDPGEFKPLPSDASKADTLKPQSVSCDEVHEWKRRELYVKLQTATGKLRQAMLTTITTAGDDRPKTLYEEMHTLAVRVLRGWKDGSFVNNRFFAIVYAVDSKADGCDEDDDPFDEANWYKANPALGFPGTGVRIEFLRSQAVKARTSPEALRDFLRLHLGRRVSAKMKPITDEMWRRCAAQPTDGPIGEALARGDWSAFKGRPCFAALDLSSSRDLTALTLYFPPWSEWPFETYRFFAWLPEENLHDAVRRDFAPYDTWAGQGWLELTHGDEVDDEAVFQKCMWANQEYLVLQWAHDPWHALQLKSKIFTATGIELVKFIQDLSSFGEPTRLFLDSVKGEHPKLRHDGNPLARWCAANVVTKEDHHGNARPHKGLSTYRIDPVVAAIMARGRAIVVPTEGNPSDNWDGTVEVW